MKKTLFIVFALMLFYLSFCDAGGFAVNKNNVYPKIITPNGDGLNDIFWVFYENLMDNEVRGKIYTIESAEVTDMVHKPGATEYSLCWDGTDGSGNIVPGGVYIYQITAENSVYNGVVVVAR